MEFFDVNFLRGMLFLIVCFALLATNALDNVRTKILTGLICMVVLLFLETSTNGLIIVLIWLAVIAGMFWWFIFRRKSTP